MIYEATLEESDLYDSSKVSMDQKNSPSSTTEPNFLESTLSTITHMFTPPAETSVKILHTNPSVELMTPQLSLHNINRPQSVYFNNTNCTPNGTAKRPVLQSFNSTSLVSGASRLKHVEPKETKINLTDSKIIPSPPPPPP